MKSKNKNPKSIFFYVGITVAAVICSIVISILIIRYGYEDTENRLFECAKLVISILGPTLTILVFYRSFEIQEYTLKNQEIIALKQKQTEDLDSVNRDFNNLINLLRKEQSKTKKEQIELASVCDSFLDNFRQAQLDVIIKKKEHDYFLSIKDNGNQKCLSKIVSDKHYEQIMAKHNVDNAVQEIREYYDAYYTEMGSYFKILYRIIKLLNKSSNYVYYDEKINMEEYSNYIGILRAILSDEEFIIILVNAVFLPRGIKMGIELIGTSFFGDISDFVSNQHMNLPSYLVDICSNFVFDENKMFDKREELHKEYDFELSTSRRGMIASMSYYEMTNYNFAEIGLYSKYHLTW